MFFYRAKPIDAKSKEELLNTPCPICGNPLVHDWCMPIRYSPMVLFRLLSFAGALAFLLCLLMLKIDAWTVFLSQFSCLTQDRIIIVGLACVCLPMAFFAIWGELKIGHLSEDDKQVYGLHCKTCGNGFAGLVDYTSVIHTKVDCGMLQDQNVEDVMENVVESN